MIYGFGYLLPLAVARQGAVYFGRCVGSHRSTSKPPPLSKSGLFLVRSGGTLYYAAVQTMSFSLPLFSELLQAIDFAIAKDYPARGEYDGSL